MLCLTRKIGQRIFINNDITVTVSEIRGGSVRIGITAPKSVKIMREEVVRPVEVPKHDQDDERELARYFKRHEKA